jgi:hypothetical protein
LGNFCSTFFQGTPTPVPYECLEIMLIIFATFKGMKMDMTMLAKMLDSRRLGPSVSTTAADTNSDAEKDESNAENIPKKVYNTLKLRAEAITDMNEALEEFKKCPTSDETVKANIQMLEVMLGNFCSTFFPGTTTPVPYECLEILLKLFAKFKEMNIDMTISARILDSRRLGPSVSTTAADTNSDAEKDESNAENIPKKFWNTLNLRAEAITEMNEALEAYKKCPTPDETVKAKIQMLELMLGNFCSTFFPGTTTPVPYECLEILLKLFATFKEMNIDMTISAIMLDSRRLGPTGSTMFVDTNSVAEKDETDAEKVKEKEEEDPIQNKEEKLPEDMDSGPAKNSNNSSMPAMAVGSDRDDESKAENVKAKRRECQPNLLRKRFTFTTREAAFANIEEMVDKFIRILKFPIIVDRNVQLLEIKEALVAYKNCPTSDGTIKAKRQLLQSLLGNFYRAILPGAPPAVIDTALINMMQRFGPESTDEAIQGILRDSRGFEPDIFCLYFAEINWWMAMLK